MCYFLDFSQWKLDRTPISYYYWPVGPIQQVQPDFQKKIIYIDIYACVWRYDKIEKTTSDNLQEKYDNSLSNLKYWWLLVYVNCDHYCLYIIFSIAN